MKNPLHDKYIRIGVIAFCVIAASIAWFFLLHRASSVGRAFKSLIGILKPIIFGFVLAYLLSPLNNRLSAFAGPIFSRYMKNQTKARNACAVTCSVLSIVCSIGLVIALLSVVLPQLYLSIISLTNNMQDYLTQIESWINEFFVNNAFLQRNVRALYDEVIKNASVWLKDDMLPWMFALMSGSVLGVVSMLQTLLVGIIVAIYMLNSKRTFLAQAKKILFTFCDAETGNLIMDNLRYTHKVFGGFITGKLIDSLIIGLITFFALTILQMPYVVLISVIVGVTNIIPYFGPFIGGIPCALLILLIEPVKAIYFIIFILILQQIDGNILGPRILGNSTGLSSFWVLFAILVFGGAFGFVGMLIGVPTMAVIFSALTGLLHLRLNKRNMPKTTEDYYDMEYMDPETLTPIKYTSDSRPMAPAQVIIRQKKEKSLFGSSDNSDEKNEAK